MFVLKNVYLSTHSYISCCLLNSRVTMVFRLLSDVDPASSSRLLAEYLVFSPTSSSIWDLELDTQISLIHKNDQATKPQHATCHMVTSFGQLEQQDKDHRRVLGCSTNLPSNILKSPLNVWPTLFQCTDHKLTTIFVSILKKKIIWIVVSFLMSIWSLSF